MIKFIIAAVLCWLSLAVGQPELQVFNFSIRNITAVSFRSRFQAVVGNLVGELEIFDKHHRTYQIKQVHKDRIIQIKEFMNQQKRQFVTVDESGLILIWNEDMSEVIYSQASFKERNIKISEVASNLEMKGQLHRSEHHQNLIALTNGIEIYEYELNSRKIKRNISSNQQSSIISLVYIGNSLVVSIQNQGLFIIAQGEENWELLYESNTTISMLASHQEEGGFDKDGVGVEGKNTIIHFDQSKAQKQNIYVSEGSQISSLCECNNPQRRQHENLMVIALDDGTLQVRSFFAIYDKHRTDSKLKDISCRNDQILYVDSQDRVVMLKFDHNDHNRGKLAGIAAAFFAVFVLGLVGYYIFKEKQKKEEGQQTYMESSRSRELQDRAVYQPPEERV